LLLVCALPLTAAGMALGPELATIVYGEDYRAVGAPLLILLAGYPLFGLTSLANALLTGLGRLRVAIAGNGFAATVDVALALALAGPLGARGAALANLSGQVVYSAVVLAYTLRIVGRARFDAAILRSAVGSAAAGAAAWGTLHAVSGVGGLVAGTVAFVAAFAALGPLLRVVPGQDVDWLVEVLGPRAPGWLLRFVQLCSRT
jgi:O-antigen/teichoic acid export membrane protein